MNIILNNNPESFEKSEMSISEILASKNFIFKMLVIKINDKVIKKDEYETTIVKEGDNVVILHLVSGG
jgi:thiamine biosynthesis protein ThiS